MIEVSQSAIFAGIFILSITLSFLIVSIGYVRDLVAATYKKRISGRKKSKYKKYTPFSKKGYLTTKQIKKMVGDMSENKETKRKKVKAKKKPEIEIRKIQSPPKYDTITKEEAERIVKKLMENEHIKQLLKNLANR